MLDPDRAGHQPNGSVDLRTLTYVTIKPFDGKAPF